MSLLMSSEAENIANDLDCVTSMPPYPKLRLR